MTVPANPWFIYALSSAILWGISYALSERLLHNGVSVPVLLVIEGLFTIPIFLSAAQLTGTLKPSLNFLFSDYRNFALAAAVASTVIAGNLFILLSISEKNATLATLIEISYPIFSFLFAWLFFRDMQLTWHTALGAVLIVSGVSIIYTKS
jgi:drug/metabolite transporter (DMT)-like permease